MPIITDPIKMNFTRYNRYIKYKLEKCAAQHPGKKINVFTCVYPVDDFSKPHPDSEPSIISGIKRVERKIVRKIIREPPMNSNKIIRDLNLTGDIINQTKHLTMLEKKVVTREEDIGSVISGELIADVLMLDRVPMIKEVHHRVTNLKGMLFVNELSDINLGIDPDIEEIRKNEETRKKTLNSIINDLKIEMSHQLIVLSSMKREEEEKKIQFNIDLKQLTESQISVKEIINEANSFITTRIELIDELRSQIDRISIKLKENDIFLKSFNDSKYFKYPYNISDDGSDGFLDD